MTHRHYPHRDNVSRSKLLYAVKLRETTFVDAARYLRVHHSTLLNYLKGANAWRSRPRLFDGLCRFLNIDPEWVLDQEHNVPEYRKLAS